MLTVHRSILPLVDYSVPVDHSHLDSRNQSDPRGHTAVAVAAAAAAVGRHIVDEAATSCPSR